MKSFYRHRKFVAFGVFSSTLLITWILKKKRLQKINHALKDCERIFVNENLFKSKVSLYRYHGFIFPSDIVLSGVLQDLPKFQFHEEDIVVASFPKSGTTWIQEIVFMLTHNFEPSNDSSEVLETRFPYLEYPYPGLKHVSELKGRRFIKTHLPSTLLPESFNSSGAKLIYIMRNPRDTAVSYWHFMKLLSVVNFVGSFSEFVDLFTTNRVPYGPFYEHIKSYMAMKNNDNVLLINYEDLKENPVAVIKEVARFLQVDIDELDTFKVAVSTSFNSMLHNKSVNYEHWKDFGFANEDGRFLRKGQVGDWKNHFTPEVLSVFEDWENRESNGIFKFRYELLS